ncbi:MAG: CRISPR-associated endonuclease Cas1, partial [Anaerolineae bacterium]|nr:CRISPR-associated endonuclease Cas1 [Anaerolineae bacterium]
METSTLIVEQFGAYVGKHSERIQVKVRGELVAEAPLLTLENVLIIGKGVSISADALGLCAEQGIPVHCLSS